MKHDVADQTRMRMSHENLKFWEKNKNSIEESEELPWIDTSQEAEYFSNLLKVNRIIFLNGEWGSGKTEFFKKIRDTPGKKFIDINLWNKKDERTVINICFSAIFPKINIILKFLLVLSVVTSLLVTPAINLGINSFFLRLNWSIFNTWILPLATIVALFVSVWQFFKYKTDDFYYWWFKQPLVKWLMKNKVLVIDDFDRVSEENQQDAYKLFNNLSGSLPIIFLGDLSKIENNKGKYLQKIIDQQIELPYKLQPTNIWKIYFELIEKKYKVELPQPLVNQFILENRNLRERKMFHYYVNQELEFKGKRNHVLIDQQLVIIYLYLFWPSIYKEILSGVDEDRLLEENKLVTFSNILSQINYVYPPPFKKNKQGYFMYEKINKLSQKDAYAILKKENILSDIVDKGSYDDDFCDYITNKYSTLEPYMKQKLMDASLRNLKENKESDLIDWIIYNVNRNIVSIKEVDSLETWIYILDIYSLDVTQKIGFFMRFVRVANTDLSKGFNDLDFNSSDFINGKQKMWFFLLKYDIERGQLNRQKKTDYFWSEEYWKALQLILNDSEEDFIYVLKYTNRINFIAKENKIIVYTEKVDFRTTEKVEGVNAFLKRLEPMLEPLKNLGYIILYEKDDQVSLQN